MTILRYHVVKERLDQDRPAIACEDEDRNIFGWCREIWFGPDFDIGIVQKGGHVFVERDSGAPITMEGWEAK